MKISVDGRTKIPCFIAAPPIRKRRGKQNSKRWSMFMKPNKKKLFSENLIGFGERGGRRLGGLVGKSTAGELKEQDICLSDASIVHEAR